jgi:electron transfer flavoprotein alpha subunit
MEFIEVSSSRIASLADIAGEHRPELVGAGDDRTKKNASTSVSALRGFRTLSRRCFLARPGQLRHYRAAPAAMSKSDNSKRAASMLTIAQHKFKQALKKEDNQYHTPPVAIELSAQFLSDLDAVLKQNTPANVQVSDYKAIVHESVGAD